MGKVIVDGLKQGQEWVALFWGVGILGVLWWADKAIHYLEEITFFPIVNNAIKDIQHKTTMHLQATHWLDFKKLSIPKVLSALKRISLSVRFFLRVVCLLLLPTLIKMFLALGVIFGFNLLAGCIITTGLIICAIGTWKGLKKNMILRRKAWQATDKVTMAIGDSLLNSAFVRFFKNVEKKYIQDNLEEEANLWWRLTFKVNLLYLYMVTGLAFMFLGFMAWALWAVRQQTITIGDLVWLKIQIAAALLPLKSISLELRQVFDAVGDIQKIIEFLNLPTNTESPASLTKKSQILLEVDGLSFHYSNNHKLILKNIHLSIQEKDIITITGQSGSGKSTLLQHLCGLIKPQTGEIRLYGNDLQNCSMEALGHYVHYIPQEVHLFNQTLLYNLTYGQPEIPQVQVWKALEKVELAQKVKTFKYQLLTPVGERAMHLSSGEKHRVALARAYLLNPHILLLDETSQALSVDQEERILKTFKPHFKSIIMVSHRPSVLVHSSTVWSLEKDGEIKVLKDIQAHMHGLL